MSDFPQPGDFVGGRYKVASLLGEGGMGAVFAATNGATGRPVAIKWMKPQMAKSPEALARFLAEARTTARIEHPNVIQILDVGQDGDAPFLVMERLRGESLGERLERDHRIPPAEAVDIIIAACNGVAEAHSEGIIHRDLKPDNIFLCQSKDGKPRAPKVLDFGISKLFDDGGGQQQQLTQTGAIMGTPLYMSPEQLDGRREPDAAFDVYAMGVVLYETLAGKTPYNADTFFVLVQQIVAGNRVPLGQAAPWVPAELCAVVDRAMNPDREQRIATMGELLAGLQHVKNTVTLVGSSPARPVQTGPFQPQSAGPVTGPFGAPAGAPTGPITAPTGPVSAAHVPPAQAPISQPTSRPPWVVISVLGGLIALCLLVGVAYVSMDDSPGDVIATAPGVPGVPQQPGVPQPPGVPQQPTAPSAPAANAPQINLVATGACTPRFDIGRNMVIGSSGTITVNSVGNQINGSLTVKLPGPGVHQINTNQTTQGVIVQVMAVDSLWMAMAMAMNAGDVMGGNAPDPISGTIHARQFDAATSQMDLTFENVVLQHAENGGLCTLNGTVRTAGRYTGF
ncbi:MAG: serine/threonine protein kinase [Polyangiales bacterium]